MVFYCHFPDKLLSGGWEIGVDQHGEGKTQGSLGLEKKGVGLVKRMYRWPVDKLEEWTTGQPALFTFGFKEADRIRSI